MKKFILFILLIAGKATFTFSQTEGKVNFVQDQRIMALINKHIDMNTNSEIRGYRIKIYSGIDKNKARDMKAKFVGLFDVKAYEKYDQPNFTIRVGDFKTKLEAFKFLKEVQQYFPSAFLVQDLIEQQ